MINEIIDFFKGAITFLGECAATIFLLLGILILACVGTYIFFKFVLPVLLSTYKAIKNRNENEAT